MSTLKELTWEHHKNAERQEFVKELMSGAITKERYATFLYNLHPQYNILEIFSMTHNLLDTRRAPSIHEDYKELWENADTQPPLLPVVKEYMDHIMSIQHDENKLMAHIYVRHMGDLSGGQMISKKVPGEGRLYKFEEDVAILKEKIRNRLDDSMADEAKICFDFATKMFQQMMEIK
jgi:heme oxygenase